MNIFQSIAAIMADAEPIGKNKKNQQQNFMYRGIDDMYNELQPLFAKHKVFITSEVLEISREERTAKQGGLLLYSVLKVKFTFHAEDGSSVASTMTGEAMDSGDKSANKAMSIALKYCLMQLLLIRTADLNKTDGDGQSHELQAQQQPEPETLLPWLNKNTPEYAGAVTKMAAGKSSIDELKKYFRLSREIQNDLLTESNNLKNKKITA